MTCDYCASELPQDALFCGECGRAVLVETLVSAGGVAEAAGESAGEMAGDAGDAYARFAPPPEVYADIAADAALRCPQCDSVIDDADVFCGECGFVLHAVVPGPRDSSLVEQAAAAGASAASSAVSGAAADPVAAGDHAAADSAWPFVSAPAAAASSPLAAGVPLLPATPASSDSQPRKDPIMETDEQQDEAVPATARARTLPDPFPWGSDIDEDDDIEATRIVTSTGGGDRFVLQFSTGESVTVSGAGLIGRNPAAQPGEYVDQLVSIFDVGKSVSKTHLEFGQEGGRFWVSDRYSTNGSVVRQPEAEPRRCEPGRRYFVVRGTRIDVGEQFFVVS